MESFLAQKKELKDTAQRAFVAYVKSVFLMKNKNVFRVDTLNLDAFARSLGLIITPRVRFLDRINKKKKGSGKTEFNFEATETKTTAPLSVDKTNALNKVKKFDSDDEDEDVQDVEKQQQVVATNGDEASDSDTEDDDDFMTVKRRDHEIEEEKEEAAADSDAPEEESILYQPQSKKKLQAKPQTKAALAKKVLKKKIVANKKVQFDEEGDAVAEPLKQLQSELGRTYEQDDAEEAVGGIDIEKAKRMLREEDKFDKARFKELVKARNKLKKQKKLAKEEKKKRQMQGESDGEDDEQEMDDFGSDEEGDLPDLSWLPDPDKIYGKGSDDDDKEEEEMFHRPPQTLVEKKSKKRSRREENEVDEGEQVVVDKKKSKKSKKEKPNLAEDLTLNEAEAIALRLLNG